MRFSLQNPSEGRWLYELLSDDNQSLLQGIDYPSRDNIVNSLQNDVIPALRDKANFSINNRGNNPVLELRSETGKILARNSNITSLEKGNAIIENIQNEALKTTNFKVELTTTTTVTERRKQLLNKELPTPPTIAELTRFYNFSWRSSNRNIGPELFEDNGKYFYVFNDDNGRAILYSRAMDTGGKRKTNLRTVLRYGSKDKYYERLEDNGQFFFVIRTPNGFETARSPMFDTIAEREVAIQYIIKNAPNYKADYAKASRKKGQEYFLDRPSISGQKGFETFKNNENKKHYFHFNDARGKAVLYSQGYRGGKARDNGILSVLKNSKIEERYRIKEIKGKWHILLLAGNNTEIARSRAFSSISEAEEMKIWLLGALPSYAAQYGVEFAQSTVRTETEVFTLESEIEQDQEPEIIATTPIIKPEPEVVRAAAPIPPKREKVIVNTKEHKVERETDITGAIVGGSSGGSGCALPWWLMLLLLLLLLLALFYWWKGCNTEKTVVDTKNKTTIIADTIENETKVVEKEPIKEEKAVKPYGPTASELKLRSQHNDVIRIANYLSTAGSTFPHQLKLDGIRFAHNSAKMNRDYFTVIDDMAKIMKAYPNVKMDIYGHIDGTESESYNGPFAQGEQITLSQIRARCLYKKLIKRGISANRLSFKGFGNTKPIANNDTEANRRKNRRVEVVLKGR